MSIPAALQSTGSIEYRVRRSSRARQVLVNVSVEGAVEVVLPTRAAGAAAAQAVVQLRPWIERRLSAVQELSERLAGSDGTLPLLDERLTLRGEHGRQRAERRGSELCVPYGNAHAAVERFYVRQARSEIAGRLDRAAALAGTPYTGLSIRAQRTRWASCSAAGRMSFNWRLMLAPSAVLDYVVWHEIAHLTVPNHSQRFWSLVERYRSSWRSERAWLREHGSTLRLARLLGSGSDGIEPGTETKLNAEDFRQR